MARYIDLDKAIERIEGSPAFPNMGMDGYSLRDVVCDLLKKQPAADVAPKSEVAKIFEKLKARECSNSVCAWCVHATAYGRRNEECDKPYIDKNGKEQRACFMYAKFESLIDNELAELKKKYTGEKE